MDKYTKDRFLRTVGKDKIIQNTIYIIGNNIESLINLLYASGIYNIVNNCNITKINKGDIIILFNVPPHEAVIYKIITINNDGLLIYTECDNSYCHIISDMKTDIEKVGNVITESLMVQPCIIKMLCGYIVTTIIKYIYGIGKLGNFKWYDNIYISDTPNNNIPTFDIYINKFKGSIQSILPYITSKDTIIKTYEKTYPICIIENKPTTIEHIVEWIRNKFLSNESKICFDTLQITPEDIKKSLGNCELLKVLDSTEYRHDIFMILFNKNIQELQSVFPDYDIKSMEPTGDLYEEFIKVDNIIDFIIISAKIRAYNYKIDVPTNETIIDIYNRIDPTIPSMISFLNGLYEIENIKFMNSINTLNKFYTWDIDMLENKIIRHDIIPSREIEINNIIYNEWHTFTYNNIDTTLEDMIIDLNIMYGTFIEMILYNNIIIYNDNAIIDMDINIKTLFMNDFNIDIMKESIILQLFAGNESLFPLKIEPPT